VKGDAQDFSGRVERRVRRLRRRRKLSLWQGLGVIGMVGWSVVLPTFAGLALGRWLDRQVPSAFSWALSGLAGGLLFGCIAAWRWVDQEWLQLKEESQDVGP